MVNKTTLHNREFRRPTAVDGTARQLIAHAHRLQLGRETMARHLPVELAQGWQLARLDAERLVITTDSAARATRLRYARAALLQAAAERLGIRAKTLTIKLTAPRREPEAQPRAQLSAAAGASLRQAIQGMEDGELRQALAKLARRTRT